MTNARGRILKMEKNVGKLYSKEWLRTSPVTTPISDISNPFDA